MDTHTLHRAHAMHDINFRLSNRELVQIHKHQHPFMRSPFQGSNSVDQIQKQKPKGSHVRNTKFGKQHYADSLYQRPYPGFA